MIRYLIALPHPIDATAAPLVYVPELFSSAHEASTKLGSHPGSAVFEVAVVFRGQACTLPSEPHAPLPPSPVDPS